MRSRAHLAHISQMRLMVMQNVVKQAEGNEKMDEIIEDLKKRRDEGSSSAAMALDELNKANNRLTVNTEKIKGRLNLLVLAF